MLEKQMLRRAFCSRVRPFRIDYRDPLLVAAGAGYGVQQCKLMACDLCRPAASDPLSLLRLPAARDPSSLALDQSSLLRLPVACQLLPAARSSFKPVSEYVSAPAPQTPAARSQNSVTARKQSAASTLSGASPGSAVDP